MIYDGGNYDDLTKYNLNKRQLEAFTKMINEKYIFNYKSYCEYFNISKSTAKRDLLDLLDKNLLKEKLFLKILIFQQVIGISKYELSVSIFEPLLTYILIKNTDNYFKIIYFILI